jgi:hypothetical protein
MVENKGEQVATSRNINGSKFFIEAPGLVEDLDIAGVYIYGLSVRR